MSGKRFNKGKLRWALIDFKSVEEMVKVLEEGAIKYAPENWREGLHREEILESVQRHLVELFDKQEYDQDPKHLHEKTHHMGHIMCNAMFYLYHHRNKSFSKKRNNPFKKLVKGLTKTNSKKDKKLRNV